MSEEFCHPTLYPDLTPIKLGDRVRYNNQPGKIAFIAATNDYSPEFPKEDWSDQEGFMISFENGALLHMTESDSHLEFISRQA